MILHLVPQTQRSIVCVVNDERGCFQKQSNIRNRRNCPKRLFFINVFPSRFLCPALNRDFSQVYNSHRSFARLTAPYPSAFICRGGARLWLWLFFFPSWLKFPGIPAFAFSPCLKKRREKNSRIPACSAQDRPD